VLTRLRVRLSYLLARRMFHWPWLLRQPRAWRWMEGQFARQAGLGDVQAQSFYGHILLFRGQGLAARQEGQRLLTLAAQGGDGKAAYQLGQLSWQGDAQHAAQPRQAEHWWLLAAEAGHPLAAHRLSKLYAEGAEGIAIDLQRSAQFRQRAEALGL
jgi:TPR repeat protein